MIRTRYAQALDSRRRTTIATRLMAGGALLTLLPWVMAKAPGEPPLDMPAPLGWLLLAIGIIVLLRRPWRKRAADEAGSGAAEVGARSAKPAIRADAAASTMSTAPRRLDAGILRRIDSWRFEAVIEALFARTGFETRSQAREPDGGVDVWLYSRGIGGVPASMVRCMHRLDKRFVLDQLRELKSVMASRGVRRGHFATTALLAADAIAFARSNGIHLLDVNGLLQMIAKLPVADQQALLAVVTDTKRGGQPAGAAESGASNAGRAAVLPFLRNAEAIRAAA